MFHRAVINTLENRVKEIENGFADTECAVMMNEPRSQAVHIWGVKACQRGRSMMTERFNCLHTRFSCPYLKGR